MLCISGVSLVTVGIWVSLVTVGIWVSLVTVGVVMLSSFDIAADEAVGARVERVELSMRV